MKIVALLTARNEERVLGRCLEHLEEQGIETCVVDNGSTDATAEIARSFLGRGVLRVESLPFGGAFALHEILRNEERLAQDLDADWFLHHDADEIREAPPPHETLRQGIEAAERAGANAINFDEFVFVPTREDESHEGGDFVRTMEHYYFFEPTPLRRVNAWKRIRDASVTIRDSGGHSAEFSGRILYDTPFILRHYIFLSKAHALAKYVGRVYSTKEVVERGWHGARATVSPGDICLPDSARLKRATPGAPLDKSEPWRVHEFFGSAPLTRELPLRRATSESLSPSPPSPFIVGVARSGTTLLRLMLDAHPSLAIPPETHFVPATLRLEGKGAVLRESFLAELTGAHTWNDFGISTEAFRDALEQVDPFSVTDGLRSFYTLYARRFGKFRWGDKTPPYVLHLADIGACLPEARFIHVIRDGRDVALSAEGLWFGAQGTPEERAAHWLWRIREARQQAQGYEHYLEVRFEDLVCDPERVLREISEYLEIPFAPEMLRSHETAAARLDELTDRVHPSGTAISKERLKSISEMTKKPPSVERAERWRREMAPGDQRRFASVAGDLLRDLGYEC